MIALQKTFEKISALDEQNATIVVNLVDYLSAAQSRKSDAMKNPFQKAREEGIKNPMTEDEVDTFVASVRKERNADRH